MFALTVSNVTQNLDITPATVQDADFVLAHGMDGIMLPEGGFEVTNAKLGDFELAKTLLKRAAERGLPMLVANSDFVTSSPTGGVWQMPGNYAAIYDAYGGHTQHFGKPTAFIYKECIDMLATKGIEKKDIICVGDSFHHDIKGACDAGLDVLFISSGVHRPELMPERAVTVDKESLEDLCKTIGCRPTYYTELFR